MINALSLRIEAAQNQEQQLQPTEVDITAYVYSLVYLVTILDQDSPLSPQQAGILQRTVIHEITQSPDMDSTTLIAKKMILGKPINWQALIAGSFDDLKAVTQRVYELANDDKVRPYDALKQLTLGLQTIVTVFTEIPPEELERSPKEYKKRFASIANNLLGIINYLLDKAESSIHSLEWQQLFAAWVGLQSQHQLLPDQTKRLISQMSHTYVKKLAHRSSISYEINSVPTNQLFAFLGYRAETFEEISDIEVRLLTGRSFYKNEFDMANPADVDRILAVLEPTVRFKEYLVRQVIALKLVLFELEHTNAELTPEQQNAIVEVKKLQTIVNARLRIVNTALPRQKTGKEVTDQIPEDQLPHVLTKLLQLATRVNTFDQETAESSAILKSEQSSVESILKDIDLEALLALIVERVRNPWGHGSDIYVKIAALTVIAPDILIMNPEETSYPLWLEVLAYTAKNKEEAFSQVESTFVEHLFDKKKDQLLLTLESYDLPRELAIIYRPLIRRTKMDAWVENEQAGFITAMQKGLLTEEQARVASETLSSEKFIELGKQITEQTFSNPDSVLNMLLPKLMNEQVVTADISLLVDKVCNIDESRITSKWFYRLVAVVAEHASLAGLLKMIHAGRVNMHAVPVLKGLYEARLSELFSLAEDSNHAAILRVIIQSIGYAEASQGGGDHLARLKKKVQTDMDWHLLADRVGAKIQAPKQTDEE